MRRCSIENCNNVCSKGTICAMHLEKIEGLSPKCIATVCIHDVYKDDLCFQHYLYKRRCEILAMKWSPVKNWSFP